MFIGYTGLPVICGLGIRVMLASLNEQGSFPPLPFSGSLCRLQYYFFFKYWVEFSSKVIWTWSFLCGKVLNYKVNLFIRYSAIRVTNFLLERALVVCVFQGIFLYHLSCQMYWHKVVHYILLLFLKIFIYFLAASGLSCITRDLSFWCMGSSLWCAGFSLVVAHRLISCSVQALQLWHMGSLVAVRGLSSCGAQAPEHMSSVVAARRLISLWRTGSVVAARRLSCHVACGILVPQPGIEPVSLALQD